MTLISCTLCGKKYPDQQNPFCCECGGTFDFKDFPLFETKDMVQKGVWAYQKSLGLPTNTYECQSWRRGNTSHQNNHSRSTSMVENGIPKSYRFLQRPRLNCAREPFEQAGE